MTRRLQRVLLVDDDEDIRRIGELGLSRVGGLEVQTCRSGFEALERAPAFLPELILLDVMMPGMDGPDVLQALAKVPSCENVPVIFVTARAQKTEIARYLELGAIGVIKKPFDPMSMADEIRRLWSHWLEGQEQAAQTDDEDFDELAARYRRKVVERVDTIVQLLSRSSAKLDTSSLEEMRSLAHKLAGTGAIFGLPEVSDICGEFEDLLVEMLDDDARPNEDDLRRLRSLCARMSRYLDAGQEPPALGGAS